MINASNFVRTERKRPLAGLAEAHSQADARQSESAQGRSATLVATDVRFALFRDQIQDISTEDCEAPSQPRCLLWGHVRRGLPWPPVCPLPLCSVRDSRPAQGALMLLSTLRNRRSQIRSGVRANQLPRGVSRAEAHLSATQMLKSPSRPRSAMVTTRMRCSPKPSRDEVHTPARL